MQSSPTMQDVARAAKCSRSAVSLALRGDKSIPEKTRRRILEAACRVGYQPNPLVSALMSLHRRGKPLDSAAITVGYLTSHTPDNPWHRHSPYVSMFEGAVKRGIETGYHVEELNLRAKGMTPARMGEILAARAIHAVIVAPLPRRETSIDFDFSSIAVVGLGMSVRTPTIECISNDHYQSARLAVDECVKMGYRRIGLVLSHETSLRLDHRWLAGYKLAVGLHGLDHVPPLMAECSDALPPLVPAWQKKHKPDVVIFDNSYPEYLCQVPASVGVASLTVERPEDAVSGIFQNNMMLGGLALDHVAAKLRTNSFGTLKELHCHFVAGTWVHGATTPGPGRRRPMPGEKP